MEGQMNQDEVIAQGLQAIATQLSLLITEVSQSLIIIIISTAVAYAMMLYFCHYYSYRCVR